MPAAGHPIPSPARNHAYYTSIPYFPISHYNYSQLTPAFMALLISLRLYKVLSTVTTVVVEYLTPAFIIIYFVSVSIESDLLYTTVEVLFHIIYGS